MQSVAIVAAVCAVALITLTAAGCESQEEEFTHGRLEQLCQGAIPICDLYAGCVLASDEFIAGRFPGAQRAIVPVESGQHRLRIRLLFSEMVFPGTEFLLQVNDVGCGRVEQEQLLDVDVFGRAGGDRVLQFDVDLKDDDGGDRLVEIFSDMAASWLLVIEPLTD